MQAHTDHRQDSGGRKGRHTHQHIAACAVRQQRRAVGPLDGGAGCPADEMSQRAGQTQSQRGTQGFQPPQRRPLPLLDQPQGRLLHTPDALRGVIHAPSSFPEKVLTL